MSDNYNEDEYFLKFLKIHRFLTYSENILDKKKLKYQTNLLIQLHNNEITKNELIIKYNSILKIETQLKNNLESIKHTHRQIEKQIYNNNIEELIKLYD